jgi:Domain of unknown function (DUF1942)
MPGRKTVRTTQEYITVKITKITCAFVAAGAVGFLSAPIALAEGPSSAAIGSPAKLYDAAGNIVQSWTITGLKPSSDVIPYPVAGTLWEATATDEAVMGGVTPIVSNLNARAGNGENYQALFGVATPQGVNPATLAQGQKTSGKVYFDVIGAAPISVVYNAGGVDVLVWAGMPAPARTGGGGTASSAGTGAASTPIAETVPGAASEGTEAAEGTPGTPATPGSMGTPVAPGSMGTPLPAASQGTPVPAGSEGTPVPAGSEGTPVSPAPATPKSVGTEGAPMVAPSTPVTPAPVR